MCTCIFIVLILNQVWSESFCRSDSDGDGRTNGEELGDPECTWSQGQELSNPATGHPGMTSRRYVELPRYLLTLFIMTGNQCM